MRDVLEQAPNFHALSSEQRTALAKSMVQVSTLAAELIAEEGQAEGEIERRAPARPAPPLAMAQEQPGFGEAANRIAGITHNVLNAVSFPRFVTDLINGVFRAMVDANQQQMQQYVQLLQAVSASAEGFERSQFGLAGVRQWVADHFSEAIEYDAPDPEDEPDPEEIANITLRLRGGASMPGSAEIRATLGIPENEPVEASNPEQLVPLARRYLARQRQQQLATMVMLGMQRIVIDSGKINAAMRFHIDTRSAASEDRGSQFGIQNRIRASGSFGVGPWGASAEAENTISYVSTQRSQNTEEINTDLELNSSVELNFHTDYLPLNRMAAQAQADRIRNATLNPAAETADPVEARNTRLREQLGTERERRSVVDGAVAEGSRVPPLSTASPPPEREAPAAESPPAGGGEASAGGNPPAGGGEAPAGGNPPADGGEAPAGEPPPAGGSEAPAGGNPPAGGGEAPADGNPPAGGGEAPTGGNPPAGGGEAPAGGNPPAGGGSPAGGTPPAGNASGSSGRDTGSAVGGAVGSLIGNAIGGQAGGDTGRQTGAAAGGTIGELIGNLVRR